jgi:hypothetical protein
MAGRISDAPDRRCLTGGVPNANGRLVSRPFPFQAADKPREFALNINE